MKADQSGLKVVAVLLGAAIAPLLHAAPAASTSIPPEALAVLTDHIGSWQTEGTLVVGGESQPAKASWECEHAAGGVGLVCSWEHEWADGRRDTALELIGYDPVSQMLTWSRVTDQGVIRVVPNEIRGNTLYFRWESTQDGKPLVGVNQVFMRPGEDDWTQQMTIDVDGKRTTEMNLTHHRVK